MLATVVPPVQSKRSFNLAAALAETARANPHAVAIVNGKDVLSYRELASRGEALCGSAWSRY